MDQLTKVFAQTFWQILGKGATSFSTLFILGFVSRSFGSEGIGYLTLSLSYLGFFSLVVDLGLNGYLLPRLMENNFEYTWKRLFGLRLILAFLSIALAYFFVFSWPSSNFEFKQLVLIGAFIAILEQAVFSTTTALLQSKLKYQLALVATTLGYIFILIFAATAHTLNLSLPYFMLSYVAGWFLIIVASLWLMRKFIKNITPVFDLSFIKSSLKSAWPISATLVLNMVYFRLDSFLISFFRNFFEVGIYNLSYQIFQAALVLPTFIMNGYYPLMLANLKEDKNKFKANLKKAGLIMFLIGCAGFVFTWFFAELLINLISGGGTFSDSVLILKILSSGFPFFFVSSLLMWVLVTIKEYKALVKIYVFGLLINLILNLIFVPRFSYWAASYVTVFSEGAILFLQAIFLYRKLFR